MEQEPQQQPQPKRMTLLALSIRKDLPNEDYATLTWSIFGNYPRIKVYTTKDVKKEDGSFDYDKIVIAPFTYPVLYTLIDNLEDMVSNDTSIVTKMTCYNNKFVENKRTDEIITQAEIKLARTQEGVINIGIKTPSNWIYFALEPDLKWHRFFDKDGNEITNKKVLSNMFTKAYVKLLREAYVNII